MFFNLGRPWLVDDLDEWIHRLQNDVPHKCAAIFVDNSGVDIVLGILPFARDLLQRGTKVNNLCIYCSYYIKITIPTHELY